MDQKLCDYPQIYPKCTGNATLIALSPDAADLTLYADLFPDLYPLWRAIFLICGIVLIIVNVYRLRLALVCRSTVHIVVYSLLLLIAFTFILRGIDPHGYRNILPLTVVQCANIFTNGFLYSIFYAIGIIWGSVLQSYHKEWRIPALLKLFGVFLLIVTWGILCLLDSSIAINPSGDHIRIVLIKYYTISFTGFAGCVLIGYTGVALDRRIKYTTMLARQSVSQSPANVYKVGQSLPGTPSVSEEGGGVRISSEAQIKGKTTPGMGKKLFDEEEPQPIGLCALRTRWNQATKVMKIVLIILPLYGAVEVSTMLRGVTAHIKGSDYTGWQSYNYCVYSKGVIHAGRGGECDPTFDYMLFSSLQLCFAILNTWIFSRIKGGSGSENEEEDNQKDKDRTMADTYNMSSPLSSQRDLRSSDSSMSFWSETGDDETSFTVMNSLPTGPTIQKAADVPEKPEKQRSYSAVTATSSNYEDAVLGRASEPVMFIESEDGEKMYFEEETEKQQSRQKAGTPSMAERMSSYRKL